MCVDKKEQSKFHKILSFNAKVTQNHMIYYFFQVTLGSRAKVKKKNQVHSLGSLFCSKIYVGYRYVIKTHGISSISIHREVVLQYTPMHLSLSLSFLPLTFLHLFVRLAMAEAATTTPSTKELVVALPPSQNTSVAEAVGPYTVALVVIGGGEERPRGEGDNERGQIGVYTCLCVYT